MSVDTQFLADHFKGELARISARVDETQGKTDLHQVFGDVDDDLYFYLLKRQYQGFDSVRRVTPDWPPEDIRTGSTSSLPLSLSMAEARFFWEAIKRHIGKEALRVVRVADYGAGWGRISRFAAKDLPNKNLYAFEPNPVFCDLYEKCRCPGTLVRTDWESQKSLTAYGTFDVVYCFSILTHSSDSLTRRIAQRWQELTLPGGLVFTTIRPRYFIDGDVGDAAVLPSDKKAAMRSAYDSGELVYERYEEGNGEWGVAVMPLQYVQKIFTAFDVVTLYPNPITQNQMLIVMKRK